MRFDWQDTLAFEDPKDPTLLAWFHTHFLPVIQFSESTHRIEDFNPKSIKRREIVGKVYNFQVGRFKNKIQ